MSYREFGPLPDGPLNADTENKFIKLRTKLQVDLLQDYLEEHNATDLSEEERHIMEEKWANETSKKFGEIFHRLVVTNPHFKEDIETIPDAVYEQIKLELYHDDSRVQPEEYLDNDTEQPQKAA